MQILNLPFSYFKIFKKICMFLNYTVKIGLFKTYIYIYLRIAKNIAFFYLKKNSNMEIYAKNH